MILEEVKTHLVASDLEVCSNKIIQGLVTTMTIRSKQENKPLLHKSYLPLELFSVNKLHKELQSSKRKWLNYIICNPRTEQECSNRTSMIWRKWSSVQVSSI